jgi:ubiquinone/menaquinone biosynthesis C-methylase UbiE
MEPAAIQQENEALRQMWEQYSPEHLDTYLVAGVEDPRLNIQSILTRALLADSLLPGRFEALINEELRYGTVLTWLHEQLKAGANRDELRDTICYDKAPSLPAVVTDAARWLETDACPLPHYLELALDPPSESAPDQLLPERALNVFGMVWRRELAGLTAPRLRVLEVACGSANDYRALHDHGLAPFLDYTGLDISEKNIANARTRFPGVDFRAGSILASGWPDGAFDFVFAHDLLEHLSSPGAETALAEMVRLARREVWLHLFNTKADGEHEIVPKEKYHWNLLARAALLESGRMLGCAADLIEIAPLLQHKFAFAGHYNPRAATLILKKTR